MIRRMRTAFKPTEDASFNVRIENQKIIAQYLKKHPMGAGIGGHITTPRWENDQYIDYRIPPDSFYPKIKQSDDRLISGAMQFLVPLLPAFPASRPRQPWPAGALRSTSPASA